ncbi:dedicator of cytokinesis protein 5-like [Corticium candelabrum]|uniref:dedicator of cytokinesis protein 5-like n=1 Tax=Corticium candelabrum TaxID=121492 RepID=UPI002E26E015|nr:dedicator of cytokinesis protein 5-like [Corticium candelabrum]
MDVQHYRDYISSFVDREPLLEFLIEVFGVFMDLVTRQPYSQDWFVMAMLHNSGILSGITSFSEALYTHFLTVDLFDLQLWNTYFHLSVAFVCQETLHLEKYSLPKQRKVLRR